MKTRKSIFKPSKALILPAYESPLFRLLPMDMSKYLRNEFYMYPKSLNEEFIVYRLNRTDIDAIEFAFYRPNGKYESSIRLKIHGVKNYTNANVTVSPNGRYVFYVEENDEYDPAAAIEHSKSFRGERHTIKTTKLIGRVSEIVSLRTKKDKMKILKILKNAKNLRGKTLTNKFDEASININDITFSLKPIRSISDVGNTLSLYDDPNKDEQEEQSRLFITNTGSVVFIDKISQRVFFNDFDMYKLCEGKLGYQPGSKQKHTIMSINWAFSQNGLVAFDDEKIYYLGVDPKKGTPLKIQKIDFKINKARLYIKNVHGCPNPQYILIAISNKYNEQILLVWDIKNNCEKYNYSVVGDYSFISKNDSDFGIILSKDFYINLDNGLINYYFDRDFEDYPWGDDDQGCKMDKKEQTILYKGKLLMKEMYSE